MVTPEVGEIFNHNRRNSTRPFQLPNDSLVPSLLSVPELGVFFMAVGSLGAAVLHTSREVDVDWLLSVAALALSCAALSVRDGAV